MAKTGGASNGFSRACEMLQFDCGILSGLCVILSYGEVYDVSFAGAATALQSSTPYRQCRLSCWVQLPRWLLVLQLVRASLPRGKRDWHEDAGPLPGGGTGFAVF